VLAQRMQSSTPGLNTGSGGCQRLRFALRDWRAVSRGGHPQSVAMSARTTSAAIEPTSQKIVACHHHSILGSGAVHAISWPPLAATASSFAQSCALTRRSRSWCRGGPRVGWCYGISPSPGDAHRPMARGVRCARRRRASPRPTYTCGRKALAGVAAKAADRPAAGWGIGGGGGGDDTTQLSITRERDRNNRTGEELQQKLPPPPQ